jgi:hypothetical protein
MHLDTDFAGDTFADAWLAAVERCDAYAVDVADGE